MRACAHERHIKGREHQIGAQMGQHRPPDDASAEGIHTHGQVEKTRSRWHVGDVGHPEFVRSLGGEVALDEIRRARRLTASYRCTRAFAAADTFHACCSHQTSDSLARDGLASLFLLGMDARCSVGAIALRVDRADLGRQGGVSLTPGRWNAVAVGVETAAREAEHAAHRLDRKYGLIRLHEFEAAPPGRALLSRANQAAAFERISRSKRSWRTSLRRRSSPPARRAKCRQHRGAPSRWPERSRF